MVREAVYALTGVSGFLGKRLLTELRSLYPHATLRVLVHKTEPRDLPADVEITRGSLADPESLREFLQGVETVIHVAGVTHSDRKETYLKVNAGGTKNLLEAACGAGVSRFIYISTRAIGVSCGDYGLSKEIAERFVIESGIPYVIFRPAEIYGEGLLEGFGQLLGMIKRFPVIPYPVSASTLSPLYIADAVSAVAFAVGKLELQSRIYTLAGPRSYSFPLLIEEISKALGIWRRAIPVPDLLLSFFAFFHMGIRYDQLKRASCRKDNSSELASRELRFRPRLLEEGLRLINK